MHNLGAPSTLPSMWLTVAFSLFSFMMLCITAVLIHAAMGRLRPTLIALCALVLLIVIELLLAQQGLLYQFESLPPGIAKMLVPLILLNITFSCCSSLAQELAKLGLRTLIGFQSFRFGPEVFLHLGYVEGSLPIQMTWSGRNVDIYVAVLASILAVWPRPLAAPVAWLFALSGFGSLLNILGTAFTSLAYPLRDRLAPSFEPGLEAVALPPYVLLPGFLFQLALCGHIILFRHLLSAPPSSAEGGQYQAARSMR